MDVSSQQTYFTEDAQGSTGPSPRGTITRDNRSRSLSPLSPSLTQEHEHYTVETSQQGTSQVSPEHEYLPSSLSVETNESGPQGDHSSDGLSVQKLEDITPRPADQVSRLPIKETLGLSGSLSIIGGSIAALGLLSFLVFLWLGHGSNESADATWVWRQIAIHDRMTQAVTLLSLALRFTISLQSAVCTSMLAALVLEKRFARRSDVAWLSVMRGINDGPTKMIMTMLPSRHVLWHVEFWLLALLALGTFGLQFSSTILLSDFTNAMIVGDVNLTRVPDLISTNGTGRTLDIVLGSFYPQAPTFGVFGEVGTSYDATPDTRGVSYTGLVQRGLLPFPEKEKRTSIRKFKGNAIVMNSKLVCMPPSFDENTSFVRDGEEIEDGSVSLDISLEGRLQRGRSFREAFPHTTNPFCNADGCDSIAFSCGFPLALGPNPIYFPSTLCYIGRVSDPRPIPYDYKPIWNSSRDAWSKGSQTFLVLSSSMETKGQVPSSLASLRSTRNDEWRTFEVKPGYFLNISLCFAGHEVDRKLVNMAADWELEEPLIQWSGATAIHNSSDVQRQMGSRFPRGSLASRNILEMKVIGEPEDGPPTSAANRKFLITNLPNPLNLSASTFTLRTEEVTVFSETATNNTYLNCQYCSSGGEVLGVAPVAGILFSDIIAQTGRAANAILSFYTGVMWTVHYSFLSVYDIFHEAQITSTIVARTPSRCTENGCSGLISVAVLLAVHLTYVAVIATLYVRQVRFSRYGNIWHTVSQLMSEETMRDLGASNNACDKAVFRDRDDEEGENFVKLGRLENGRIEVMKYHQETKAPNSSLLTKFRGKLASVEWRKALNRRSRE
ncbi:hypothetical protein F4802DRAFT_217124 [Xylaria palmicola]|nr:hypothetical protein F4802DRAFT_217124 [Xylaria palmicola]